MVRVKHIQASAVGSSFCRARASAHEQHTYEGGRPVGPVVPQAFRYGSGGRDQGGTRGCGGCAKSPRLRSSKLRSSLSQACRHDVIYNTLHVIYTCNGRSHSHYCMHCWTCYLAKPRLASSSCSEIWRVGMLGHGRGARAAQMGGARKWMSLLSCILRPQFVR